MAFLNRLGSVVRQSVGTKISASSSPSFYQALRCMSSSRLYVGGIPWSVDDSTLREAFSQYGEVLEARVIMDREQNRSKGFGFVTFSSEEEASSAIEAMDGQDVQGRAVKVSFATGSRGGGYVGGGGGGSYGGSGGYGRGGSDSYGGGGYGGGANER